MNKNLKEKCKDGMNKKMQRIHLIKNQQLVKRQQLIRGQRGITLLALIITVILLLIVSGITLNAALRR